MPDLVSCGRCGRSWRQRGNRTGHCARCHETFEGSRLFDAHQRQLQDGRVDCLNPREMTMNSHPLIFDGTHGHGSWHARSTIRDFRADEGVSGTSERVEASDPVNGRMVRELRRSSRVDEMLRGRDG